MQQRVHVLIIAASIVSASGAVADPARSFWDAVYATTSIGERSCTMDKKAPAKCRASNLVSKECQSYLEWEGSAMIQCPGLCGNTTRATVDHGVLKFDIDYIGPGMDPNKRAGDPPDHYGDRQKQTRHFEIALSKGTASVNQYDNTKHYVEIPDLVVPIAPALKGVKRDGRKFTQVLYDKVRIATSIGENAGRCDQLTYSADKGRLGSLHVDFIAPGDDDAKLSCEVLLYGPDYKAGRDCGRHERECVGRGQTCGDCCKGMYCNMDEICVPVFP